MESIMRTVEGPIILLRRVFHNPLLVTFPLHVVPIKSGECIGNEPLDPLIKSFGTWTLDLFYGDFIIVDKNEHNGSGKQAIINPEYIVKKQKRNFICFLFFL